MALSNFVVSTLPEVQTINLPMSSSLAGQTFTENVWSVQRGIRGMEELKKDIMEEHNYSVYAASL